MDFGRVRTTATVCMVAAAVCLVLGLVVYAKGSVAGGVILMIIGVSVGIIASSVLRLLSLVDNPWLATRENKKPHRRCDGCKLFSRVPVGTPDRS